MLVMGASASATKARKAPSDVRRHIGSELCWIVIRGLGSVAYVPQQARFSQEPTGGNCRGHLGLAVSSITLQTGQTGILTPCGLLPLLDWEISSCVTSLPRVSFMTETSDCMTVKPAERSCEVVSIVANFAMLNCETDLAMTYVRTWSGWI